MFLPLQVPRATPLPSIHALSRPPAGPSAPVGGWRLPRPSLSLDDGNNKRRTFDEAEQLANFQTQQQQPVESASKRRRRDDARRREQCRTNQQRYRDKQKFAVLRLEADVLRLRQAIKWQEVARNALNAGSDPTAATVLHVAREFFAMFRFGLSGASLQLPIRPHCVTEARATSRARADAASPMLIPGEADDQVIRSVLPQLAFLHTVFAHAVELGELHGVDAVVEQWWRYSCYFTNLRLELEDLKMRACSGLGPDSASTFVLATAHFTLGVSAATMAHVFPHVEEDEWIIQRLVGQRLECPVEIAFEFSGVSSEQRITRVHIKVDFLSALREALGRLDIAVEVLERALISPEGLLGELRGHPEGTTWT